MNTRQHEDRYVWNISPDQNWSDFQNEISHKFAVWDHEQIKDIDSLWMSWKNIVVDAASTTIGLRKVKSQRPHVTWGDSPSYTKLAKLLKIVKSYKRLRKVTHSYKKLHKFTQSYTKFQ